MATSDFTAELLAWARTQPPERRYNYCSAETCALAQFGIATGRPHLVGVDNVAEAYPDLYGALNPVSDLTYGGLVTRLEQVSA